MQVQCQQALKQNFRKLSLKTQLLDWVICAAYWTSKLIG